MSGLKILFMGTPDFAEASLRALCSAGERVAGVITGEDKPKGRGMKLGFSEVKSYALSENIPVPIIHGIYETGMEIQKNQIEKVGLMATDGTIQSRIFQNQLEDMGIEVLLPDEKHQKYVMDVIYKDVKAGRTVEEEKFLETSRQLQCMGAQVILLGCTELSLVKRQYPLGKKYLDAMEVLAQRSVVRCGKKLKKEYENLLSH